MCECMHIIASQSHTFHSGNSSYMPLSWCCTWRETQSNTKHEEGGRGRGGLLASCRLNKSRVKEMEREAIFTDNLLFFMGWIRTVWTKGVGDQQWARTREKRQEQRGNVWQRSAFKDTVSRIYMRAGCTHWVWWVLAGWFPTKVWCSQLVKEAPGTTGIWAKGDTREQNEAWADELVWGGEQRLSEQREKTASEKWFANPQKQTHTHTAPNSYVHSGCQITSL